MSRKSAYRHLDGTTDVAPISFCYTAVSGHSISLLNFRRVLWTQRLRFHDYGCTLFSVAVRCADSNVLKTVSVRPRLQETPEIAVVHMPGH